MFTIIGVYDLYYVSKDVQIKQLYDNAMDTLELCLPFYDRECISLYHLAFLNDVTLGEHYGESYHSIHIALLETLKQIDNREMFDYYITKWKSYITNNEVN